MSKPVSITVYHKGIDGWTGDWIKIHDHQHYVVCDLSANSWIKESQGIPHYSTDCQGPYETVVGSTAIDVEKGNLLTTLTSIGPSFEISLDVKINSWKSGYANIIHLSEGGECCNVGQRIPAVFTYNNGKTLYVSSAIGDDGNYGISGNWYIPEIPRNSWFKLVISQFERQVKPKQLS